MKATSTIELSDKRTEALITRWSRGLEGLNLDELYEGKKIDKQFLPSVDTRQSKLVELTVNAGIETLVHLYLSEEREEVRFDRLPLPRLVKKEAKPILEDFFASRNPDKSIDDVVQQLKNNKLIYTANDLISGRGAPEERAATVVQKIKEYDLEVNRYRAARDLYARLMIFYHDGRLSKMPEFRKPLPIEPRVKAFNELAVSMQEALKIIDAGQKNKEGARAKLEDISGNVLALKDINRICVVPKKPTTADIFSKYLQGQLSSSHVLQMVANDEGWQVSKTGALDRKILVALPTYLFDRRAPQDTSALGTLAEVKIQSTEMLEADEISHHTYNACREMAGRGKKGIDPTPLLEEYRNASDEDKVKTRLQQIYSFIEAVEAYYDEIAEQYKFSMDGFPKAAGAYPFTQKRASELHTRVATVEDLNDPKALKSLYNGMIHFTQHLFMTRAAQHRNKDWVNLYAETCFEKIAELHEKKTALYHGGVNAPPTAGKDRVITENKIREFIPIADIEAMVASIPNHPTFSAARKHIKQLKVSEAVAMIR